MGAGSGLALKSLLWFFRGIQFCCATVVLGIYSYFLAALHNHNLHISASVRAVEGIAGAAVLFTLCALLLLCCLAGLTLVAFVAIILDVCFIGAFIYVAYANRNGRGSCNGYVTTPFGYGRSDAVVVGSDGFTALPSFHTACRLQTACLAVAIIAIFFFLFSIIMEIVLCRHRRKEKRFGPGPTNNYTSGYGGFMTRFRRKRKTTPADGPNTLPEHTHPSQLGHATRQSETTEATAVGHGPTNDYTKQEAGYGYPSAAAEAPGHVPRQAPVGQALAGGHTVPPANQPAPGTYRYTDGVYDQS